MSFQFSKRNKYLVAGAIILLAFAFTPVFADELTNDQLPTTDNQTAEIITGDAVSVSDTGNDLNTNEAQITTNKSEI